MAFKTSSFKIAFKIEPDPNGGFVARAADQGIELHAATQEELKAKMRDKMRELTGIALDFDLTGGAGSGSESIHIEKKFTFQKSFTSVGDRESLVTPPNSLPGADPAIVPSGGAGGFRRFQWIVAAAVLAGMLVYSAAAGKGLPNAPMIGVVAAIVVAGSVMALLARRR